MQPDEQLRELRDRARIEEAIKRYFWGVDRYDFDLRLSAFAPEGKMYLDGNLVIGPGAPGRDKWPSIRGYPRERVLAFDHHLHQSDIRLQGDEAFAASNGTAYLTVANVGDEGTSMLVRGLRYHDHLIRVGDDWGIKERVHMCDWMFVAPADFSTPFKERQGFEAFIAAKTRS